MSFNAILDMVKIPRIASTTRKIAQHGEKMIFLEVPDLLT
jgi:hypothetical protein